MLKSKITKADWDALSDDLKAHYNQDGTNFVLDTDGARDLTTALQKEKDAATALRTQVANLTTENTTLKSSKDGWAAIETDYKDRIEKAEKKIGELQTTITKSREDQHLGAAADKIAAKFTVPGLIKNEIRNRLALDPSDNSTVRVLKDGKPSAMTLEQLEKEFVDNPDYKGIVVGNRASGSAGTPGANGTNQNYTPPLQQNGEPKPVSQMNAAELSAHIKARNEAKANA